MTLPSACPACQDDALEEVGVGTERVEELLSTLLPQARIERMDRDTTRGQALGRLLARFRAREIDILVGTQMVAKGHDFPGVTLVGVLLAEQGLKLPDFRATERTFHLLTQIAGRAGRAELPGQVLVQTYHPGHYALVMASEHDTETFLGRELEERQARGFPPCAHLALYKVTGKDRFAVQRWADDLMLLLRDIVHQDGRIDPATVVVGAAQPAVIERIKEKWRFQVLVNATQRSALRAVLTAAGEALDSLKRPSTIQLVLDVDPHALL